MTSRASSEAERKKAELLGGVGAVVLGVGLGALAGSALQSYALVILIIGCVMHGWGMFAKHRIEQSTEPGAIWWSTAAYWICWALLVLLLAIVGYRLLAR